MLRGAPRDKLTTLLGALALLVLSLALRLPHGELAEWKGDEAVQYAHARAIAREHVLPRRGLPTTDGPRLPVHFLYVLSVPLFFVDDPEAVRVFVALLSSLVIVSVFLFGKRDVGPRTALVWALLLATLPDEVRRGRWSWNPNLIPPLATLAVLLVFRSRKNPKGWAGGALLAFSTLLPLIHYSLVGVGAIALVFGLMERAKNRRASLVGGVLALLLLAPHVVIESKSGFQATRGALDVAKKNRDDPERRPLIFPKLALEAFSMGSYARAAQAEPPSWEKPLSMLVQELVLVGVLLGALSLSRGSLEPRGSALLVALAAWAPFLVLGLPARHHYVQTAVPALAFLGALALARIPLLLLPIGWAGVLATASVLQGAGSIPGGSDYDLPFFKKKAACQAVLSQELELVRYPRLEYLILLEAVWRDLPEEKRARFELTPHPVEYWDVPLGVPHPKAPRGRGEIFVEGTDAKVRKVP